MIKSIDNITVGDFTKMEMFGKVGHFRKWWNVIPVRFQVSKLNKLVSEILNLLDSNEINQNVDTLEWQVKSSIEINTLEALNQKIYLHLKIGVEVKSLRDQIKLTRRTRRKIKGIDKILTENKLKPIISLVKELTGIEISSIDDYVRFQKKLEFKKDKYQEMFAKEKKEVKEKITLLDLATSLSIYVGGSTTGIKNITIPELVSLNKQAKKKSEAEQKQLDKLKNDK